MVTSTVDHVFHFQLKSSPAGMINIPAEFTLSYDAKGKATFDKAPDNLFQQSVLSVMKKNKLK